MFRGQNAYYHQADQNHVHSYFGFALKLKQRNKTRQMDKTRLELRHQCLNSNTEIHIKYAHKI